MKLKEWKGWFKRKQRRVRISHKPLLTIEELLRSRAKNPIFTLEIAKDICRRIKKLELKK